MTLTFDDIKNAARGAVFFREEGGLLYFERFSEEQKAYYEGVCERFFIRTRATTSVILDFVTDASSMTLSYEMGRLNMVVCDFMFFDVWEDDVMTAHVGAYSREKLRETVNIPLRPGKKRVRIFFPGAFDMSIGGITLEGASLFAPSERGPRVLIHGDSITQGYDAHYPSLAYANTLIRDFDLDVINQAVGGEIFRPGMIGTAPLFDLDAVLVAYGTNDWYGGISEENIREFFKRLRSLYPDVPIFYISPIWLAEWDKSYCGVSFSDLTSRLKSIAESEGAIVINGDEIMPKVAKMYTDGEHPSDLGFQMYAKSLERLLTETGRFPRKN